MIPPIPLRAGLADRFLRDYLEHATEQARPYCQVDVNIVRGILGVPEETIRPDDELVEPSGGIIHGLGIERGGLTILYWHPALGNHAVYISCNPVTLNVSVPDEDNPEF